MSGEVVIYGVANDEKIEVAMEHVRARLHGIEIRVVFCPPSVRDLYRVPFVQDELGARFFGIDGVERFVQQRLSAIGTVGQP